MFTGEPEGVWAYIRRMSRLLFQRIQPYSLTAIISVAFIILAFLSLRFNKGTLSLMFIKYLYFLVYFYTDDC